MSYGVLVQATEADELSYAGSENCTQLRSKRRRGSAGFNTKALTFNRKDMAVVNNPVNNC